MISTDRSLYYISTQPLPRTCKQHCEIISQENEKFVAHTPCLKCHVQNNLTGLKRVYVRIGPLVCIINLLIALVTNVLVNKMLVGSEEKLMCHTFARFYVIIRSMLLYIQIITWNKSYNFLNTLLPLIVLQK